MMCLYCKAEDAERGDDGLALCATCTGRFTEGVPPRRAPEPEPARDPWGDDL